MNKILFDIFYKTIIKYQMIDNDEKIILGVSGGMDSICMLDLFLYLRDKKLLNINILVAHLNHGLRGSESDGDEIFVRNICHEKKIIFESKKIDIKDFALQKKISIEEAGRMCRYDFFYNLANKYKADKIAVAHNKNDNVETIFMNLIRGCGGEGFSGIKPVNKKIIRPMINISREQIKNYISKKNISYRTDSSNQDCCYIRNKIRNKIFPLICEINPSFMDSFLRSSKIIYHENKYLTEQTEMIINNLGYLREKETKNHETHEIKNRIKIEDIINFPEILQQKIIYLTLKKILPENISSVHVNSIKDLIKKQNKKKICLTKNIYAQRSFDEIIFYSRIKHTDFSYKIKINKPIFIPELGQNFCVTDKEIESKEVCTKIFFCDNIRDMTVRNYVVSDKIYFKNLGHKKLKKIFSERKISEREFMSIPLFVVNGNVVWIMGAKVDIISNDDRGNKYFIYTSEE